MMERYYRYNDEYLEGGLGVECDLFTMGMIENRYL